MDHDLIWHVNQWLTEAGMTGESVGLLSTVILVFASIIIAAITHFIVLRGAVNAMNLMIKRSSAKWDDLLLQNRVLEKLAIIVPVLVLQILLPEVLSDYLLLSGHGLVERLLGVTVIFLLIRSLFALLDTIRQVAHANLVSRRLPIRSMVQLGKLFLFFIGIILSISILSDESPIYFLSGLGVATGLIMLVFRDVILGFVAGIQLAANRMVSPHDWIEMDKYGADGSVEEVTLTTVKVRNWDNTITMIPAYALVSDSFKNWRGMSESGGRQIKRHLNMDINSIGFLSAEDIERLSKISLLQEYLQQKTVEIENLNAKLAPEQLAVNGRRLTNIGTFRVYLESYLRQHPQIKKEMTLMVRQLAPSEHGLPLEIYVFTNDTRWTVYEEIQANIFDHVFAVLPEFGLRAYQSPTGADLHVLRQTLGTDTYSNPS